MKLHRYYVYDLDLPHTFWMQDRGLFHQWTNVLRYQAGRELILFNQDREERLYKILKVGNDAVQLELVTELEAKIPKRDLYLCFSLLKKDKNEWILQKGTELGVRHFVPLLADRTEKTGFDSDRARKIVIEASEQCGRSDIPSLREPVTPETIIKELHNKVQIIIAEQGSKDIVTDGEATAVLIGPEGGWTDGEKNMFKENEVAHIGLSEFTLRAETAAISAAVRLL